MAVRNALLETWSKGERTFGAWNTINSAFVVELLAHEGFAYVCCDQQHGVLDYHDMLAGFQALRGTGTAALTRVLSNNPGAIMKSLDAGADGVVVPMVNNGDEARQAVQACKYPPQGGRSYGPVRASLVKGSRDPDDCSQVACIVMIETADGLSHLDEIVGVDGVDAVYVGPADLSLALGLPPGFDSPELVFKDAIGAILGACKRYGVVPGIQCTSGDMASRYAEMGFQMVTVGADASILRAAFGYELANANGIESTALAGGYS